MTLTTFAAIWGLTIKYCDLTLVTGLNDGSSWANAWQTFADVITGETSGICVAYKSRSVSRTSVIQPTVSGTAASPIVWVAVDDSDNVVDCSNWSGYGGSVGVSVDMTGSGGTVDGIYTASAGVQHRYFYGFEIKNNPRFAILINGTGNRLRFCKTLNSGSRGIYIFGQGQSAKNCISENDNIGIDQSPSVNLQVDDSAVLNSSTIGININIGRANGCLAVGAPTAVKFNSATGGIIENSILYNGTSAVELGNGVYAIIRDCIISTFTNGFQLGNTSSFAEITNVIYYAVTNLRAGAGANNAYAFENLTLSPADPLSDTGSGDYSPAADNALLKNIESCITAVVSNWRQSGTLQQIVAGGGGAAGAVWW